MEFKIASLDAGNDSLKGFIGGLSEENRIYIPNVIKRMDSRSMLSDENEPIEELHVHVTSRALKESAIYAVGNLAAKEVNNDVVSSRVKKGDSEQTVILLLTALALDAAKDSDKDVINVKYLLSTGLPLDEVKDDENARINFKKKLIESMHEVKFEQTPGGLKGKTVRIEFEDVIVSIEGYAAMINLTMDDHFNKKNHELLSKNLLITDIGGNTRDKAIIRNGKIDNENSVGDIAGIGNYLDLINKDLDREYRKTIFKSRRQLVENIIRENDPFIIKPDGKPVSIKSTVDNHLQTYAQLQYNDIISTWDNVGDLDEIYIVGGSAAIIREQLEGLNKKGKGYELHFLEADESIWSIAKAYFKILYIVSKNKGIELSLQKVGV
ncbi:hypothetical protein ACFVRR_17395 [Gottfriedia sp. NPDC057948]|uniref:Alp7A family actin-like protein n=1 Tax=Gottfriedia sp. NPDC057948 TaxID=3346287 RepID=UPI0036DE9606